MSRHTPGPWHTGQSPGQAAHGQRAIGLGLEPDGSIFGYRLGVDNDDGKYMNLSGYCSQEDARLITAAPVYAEVTPEAVDMLGQYADYIRSVPSAEIERHPYLPALEDVIERLRAAIALATGAA